MVDMWQIELVYVHRIIFIGVFSLESFALVSIFIYLSPWISSVIWSNIFNSVISLAEITSDINKNG